MIVTLGEFIDELEKLRRAHDSASTVSIEIFDDEIDIERIYYDAKMDRVYLVPIGQPDQATGEP